MTIYQPRLDSISTAAWTTSELLTWAKDVLNPQATPAGLALDAYVVLQDRLATQLCLNNNAFAVVIRDDNGWPAEVYPVPALSAEAVYDRTGLLHLRFLFRNGKI